MAGLRGSKQLWGTGPTTGAAVLTTNVSPIAVIGQATNVVIYIANTGGVSATFALEVTANTGNAPGLNEIDPANPGNYTWFPYKGRIDASALVVANATAVAIDLSPFGPQILRLHRTDGAGSTNVIAFVTAES